MTEKSDQDKIKNIEYSIKRMNELNRLREIERTHLTIIIMLIGFSISIFLVSMDDKGIVSYLSNILMFFLILLLISHLIPIYTNNLKSRIESFGSNFFIYLMIFIVLVGSLAYLTLKQYIPELLLIVIILISAFSLGVYTSNYEYKIISKTYKQLPLLYKELESKKEFVEVKPSEKERRWLKTIWITLIIGMIFPSILITILSNFNEKYEKLFLPITMPLLILVIFTVIIGLIDIWKNS